MSRDPNDRDERQSSTLSWLRRPVSAIAWVASVMVATFLIWDLIDEDSVPRALLIPFLIAAVIALAEAIARIISERHQPDELS